MSHSQQDEESHILRFFAGTTGSLLDIGAYDGITFSNTHALLQQGWRGVLVEPEPTSFMGLITNTEAFGDRVTLVNAAVSPNPGLQQFWDSRGDAVSSLDTAHVAKWNKQVKGGMRPFYLVTLSPNDLFAKFGPAEFINLDVEGINWEVFQTIPFAWPELRMICVEYDEHKQSMTAFAAERGFRVLHTTAQNLLLVR